jgi:kynurenine formamidase
LPIDAAFAATQGVPGTIHAHNGERLSGGFTQQGTHIDALGHFGALPDAWDGTPPFPVEDVAYFGGLRQKAVKPDAKRGLARLGVEHIRPIVTTAVVLDAARHLGDGHALEAGRAIGVDDLNHLLEAHRLSSRGIVRGDALLIHTGWGERWSDPDSGAYYRSGPGLSHEAAEWLADRAPVLVGLDNPFTDPVSDRQLDGLAAPPAHVPPDAPFATHDRNLVGAGILQIQNLDLAALVQDRVTVCAFLVLPLRITGGAGSPVRPVAIGTPGRVQKNTLSTQGGDA